MTDLPGPGRPRIGTTRNYALTVGDLAVIALWKEKYGTGTDAASLRSLLRWALEESQRWPERPPLP